MLGRQLIYRMGPFADEGTWMADELGLDARARAEWIFFLSPWGLPLELVSYPNGRVYEATTTARLWHAAHPAR